MSIYTDMFHRRAESRSSRRASADILRIAAALAVVASILITSILTGSCTKESAIFFDGPRVISGEKSEHLFIPETEEDFSIAYVDYYDAQTEGKWERLQSNKNADGTSFADCSWFRVESKNAAVILNVEENRSGSRRCLTIALESKSGESYITVFQKSL